MRKYLLLLLALLTATPARAALLFDYHSDSATQAKYAKAWAAVQKVQGSSTLTLTSGPSGTFGGTYLDMSAPATFPTFVGLDNLPTSGSAITVLLRVIPINASITNGFGLFGMQGTRNQQFCPQFGFEFYIGTDSKAHFSGGTAGAGCNWFNNTGMANAFTFTQNVPTDIWITWDGTTTSGSFKIYQAQNGQSPTLVDSLTPSNPNPGWSKFYNPIIGISDVVDNLYDNQLHINEVAIWDTVEVPSSYGARTQFITSTAYEGYNYTSLAANKVASGQAYGPGPGTLTGTAPLAMAATTKIGTTASDGTGTYDGSDRWTCPAAADFLDSASALKCNSLTTNRTGTYSVSNLTVGTVKHGVTWGILGASTGTYRGADLWSDPGRDNVLSTVGSYNADGTALSGNFVKAPIDKVLLAYNYGVGGSSLVGTLKSTNPGAVNVASGVDYTINNTDYTGSYVGSCISVPPGNANVRAGYAYTIDGVSLVGSMGVPPVDKVKLGYTYDGSTTGTLECTSPGDGEVSSGITFKVYSTLHTGTRNAVTNVLSQAILVGQGGSSIAPVPLVVTQGDDVIFQFAAKTGKTLTAQNLTGATYVGTVTASDGTTVSFDNSHFTTVSAGSGTFTMALSGTETATLPLTKYLTQPLTEVKVAITQSGKVMTFRGKILQVLAP